MTTSRTPKRAGTESTGSETSSVLVIDDDFEVRAVIREALTRGGYSVEAVEGAGPALQLFEYSKFDVLMLDLRMPEMDAEKLFEILCQWHPELATNVIFMTGDTASIDTQRFIATTERPILIKPFGLDTLEKAVSRELDSRKPLPG